MLPEAVRYTLIALSLIFVGVGGYYRVQSQRSGESLDRTKEGWPLLIGIRLVGLATFGSALAWLSKPSWFGWASWPISDSLRWVGVLGFACSVGWLLWMFHSLGRNLTDTVVTRREARLVDRGPYRFVRNPMYTGVLMLGISLGVALGTWLLPLAAGAMFGLFALRTRIEETYLLARFGNQYSEYMRRVGRFFPRFSQKPPASNTPIH